MPSDSNRRSASLVSIEKLRAGETIYIDPFRSDFARKPFSDREVRHSIASYLDAIPGARIQDHPPKPVVEKGIVRERIIIRNRRQAILHAHQLIEAFEIILGYDGSRHHNEPPPELWIDDKAYLDELRTFVRELKTLNALLAAKTSQPEAAKTVVDLKAHFNAFLGSYAKTLGKSAGIATVGLIVALLYQSGIKHDVIETILKSIKQ
jgi:hypothetical protein